METEYVLDGRFVAGRRDNLEGPLTIYVGEYSLSVVGRERSLARSELSVAPFHGGMLFGTTSHSQRADALKNGYELTLSGSTLGVYADGGGRDGEFDVFRLKSVSIRGAFSHAGLLLSIKSQTWPGSAVCYSARELREDVYDPIKIETDFTVPPNQLQAFMKLRIPLSDEIFSEFGWL